MRNVVIKNITDKADELSRQYNKTKDPRIKDLWFKQVRKILLTRVRKDYK